MTDRLVMLNFYWRLKRQWKELTVSMRNIDNSK